MADDNSLSAIGARVTRAIPVADEMRASTADDLAPPPFAALAMLDDALHAIDNRVSILTGRLQPYMAPEFLDETTTDAAVALPPSSFEQRIGELIAYADRIEHALAILQGALRL